MYASNLVHGIGSSGFLALTPRTGRHNTEHDHGKLDIFGYLSGNPSMAMGNLHWGSI